MGDLRARRGATMVEYSIVLLLISLVCLVTVVSVGSGVAGLFSGVIPGQGGGPALADPAPDGDDPGGAADPDSDPGKKKKKKSRARQGQPGQGNAGNDKAVGNAPGAD